MRRVLPLLVLLLGGSARGEVVDRVVLAVEDQLVLQSDVRLEDALAGRDLSDVPFWTTPATTATDRLRDAAVVRHLAGDLAVYRPDAEQVTRRVEAIRAGFLDRAAWRAFLDAHGLDEARLRSVVRGRLLVERYLRRNVAVPVEDADAWRVAARELIDSATPRLRVRAIPERAETP